MEAMQAPTTTFEQYLSWPFEGRREYVRGKVVTLEPTSVDHDDTTTFLVAVMRIYAEERHLGRVTGGHYAQMLGNHGRTPDVSFFRNDSLCKMEATHAIGGADLIVEVASPASRNVDRGEKFYEYEAAGVEEYWIVDPERRRAELYALEDGAYNPIEFDAEGRVSSRVLTGFTLRLEWLWHRPPVLKALRELGVG